MRLWYWTRKERGPAASFFSGGGWEEEEEEEEEEVEVETVRSRVAKAAISSSC